MVSIFGDEYKADCIREAHATVMNGMSNLASPYADVDGVNKYIDYHENLFQKLFKELYAPENKKELENDKSNSQDF